MVADDLVTRYGKKGVYWSIAPEASATFDARVFDNRALSQQGLITGIAGAGRGNTFFLQWVQQELVLRHYRRGGLAQRISNDQYCYWGLAHTRAFQELSMLQFLKGNNLNAPRPYACQVVRKGMFYQASLVTYRLPGQTLSEQIAKQTPSEALWIAIGRTIATFHLHAVYHADLNAHNIMIDDRQSIALIDFDRAKQRSPIDTQAKTSWGTKNIDRLQRSIEKCVKTQSAGMQWSEVPFAMSSLLQGYRETLEGVNKAI